VVLIERGTAAALPSDVRKCSALPQGFVELPGCARTLGEAQKHSSDFGRPEAFRTSDGTAATQVTF